MQQPEFKTTAHAKCILAGEHAVLRGHPAMVFPVNQRALSISYQPTNGALGADFNAPYGETLLIFFWNILHRGMKLLDRKPAELSGKFYLENSIPMGAGMGFSAALCATVAQWFVWKQWLDQQALFNFARNLEDHFHGKSSGLDIAGSLANDAVMFWMNGNIIPVNAKWKPHLYLSFSDKYSSTADCVKAVSKLWLENRRLAESIDNEMDESVHIAEKALLMDEKTGFKLLADAIKEANHCFEEWHLMSPESYTHIRTLQEAGAVAAKPTGSGNGGFILSLWENAPPENLPFKFISVY